MNITLRSLTLAALVAATAAPVAFATDGYFLQGFGAVNAAVGGAATAGNDQDLIGSIYKNPATAVLFPEREASIVFGDILPNVNTSSSVAGLGLSGSSKSTVSNVPFLSVMTTWKLGDPSMVWFAGAVSEAGLSFHAPQSLTNPIFFMQPGAAGNPFGGLFGGFGDARASLYVVRIPVGLAGSNSSGFSWGVNLAPSIGRNLFSPAVFAPPGIGANFHPIYGTVQKTDVQYGIGAQAGVRFQVDKDLSVGLSLSTPTKFGTYSWTITDPNGTSRNVSFSIDRPLTANLGFNYAFAENTHLLLDLGYIAYGSTNGFSNTGFRTDGSVAGLGWKDAYTFEVGIQHAVASNVVIRAGYNATSDPIPASATFYNVGSPLHLTQHLDLGLSFSVAPGTTIDVSYTHAFSHSQSSPWYNPYGAVAGTSVTSDISGNEFAVGTTFKF